MLHDCSRLRCRLSRARRIVVNTDLAWIHRVDSSGHWERPDSGAVLPLTFLRLVRVFFPGSAGGGVPVAGRGRGVRTGLGWSGYPGGRVAGGFEEAEPLGLAVPAVGQVQGEVAAGGAGGAGGDVDEVAA